MTISDQLRFFIRRFMKSRRSSQKEMAELAQIQPADLSRFLNAAMELRSEGFERLYQVLDLRLFIGPFYPDDLLVRFSAAETTTSLNEELRSHVRAYLKRTKTSQRDLSILAEIEPATLSRFLGRRQGLRSGTMDRLCGFIDLSLSQVAPPNYDPADDLERSRWEQG